MGLTMGTANMVLSWSRDIALVVKNHLLVKFAEQLGPQMIYFKISCT